MKRGRRVIPLTPLEYQAIEYFYAHPTLKLPDVAGIVGIHPADLGAALNRTQGRNLFNALVLEGSPEQVAARLQQQAEPPSPTQTGTSADGITPQPDPFSELLRRLGYINA